MAKCSVCNGKGKVEGCGYMMVKCTACNGIGFIEEPVVSEPEVKIVPRGTIPEETKISRSEKMKAAWVRRKDREKNGDRNPLKVKNDK